MSVEVDLTSAGAHAHHFAPQLTGDVDLSGIQFLIETTPDIENILDYGDRVSVLTTTDGTLTGQPNILGQGITDDGIFWNVEVTDQSVDLVFPTTRASLQPKRL